MIGWETNTRRVNNVNRNASGLKKPELKDELLGVDQRLVPVLPPTLAIPQFFFSGSSFLLLSDQQDLDSPP